MDDQQEMMIPVPAGLHPDTVALVRETATAMAAKLFKAQGKYNLTNGWKYGTAETAAKAGCGFWTAEECLKSFHAHVDKGDPVDCINYLAFMLHHGWSTAPKKAADIPVVLLGQHMGLFVGNNDEVRFVRRKVSVPPLVRVFPSAEFAMGYAEHWSIGPDKTWQAVPVPEASATEINGEMYVLRADVLCLEAVNARLG